VGVVAARRDDHREMRAKVLGRVLQAAGFLRCCARPRNVREPAAAVTNHFLSTPTRRRLSWVALAGTYAAAVGVFDRPPIARRTAMA